MLIDALDQLKEDLTDLQTKEKEYKNKIKDFMGTTVKAFAGTRKVTWKSASVTRIDSKRLKAEQPDLYEKYSKTTSERKFLIK